MFPRGFAATETPYFEDLNAEILKSREQGLKRCLVWKRTVQHGLDRLDVGREPLEVKQCLGREHPRNADLVVGHDHGRYPLT